MLVIQPREAEATRSSFLHRVSLSDQGSTAFDIHLLTLVCELNGMNVRIEAIDDENVLEKG